MTVGPSVYWYLTRASGAVALVLLTASVVIGIAAIARLSGPGVPRFVVDGIHRTASLLAVVFLVVHIITAVLDSFVSISLRQRRDPVHRFLPAAVARARGGGVRPDAGGGDHQPRSATAWAMSTWRAVHWLAYAAWPVAVVHGFGTGSDVRQTWLEAINVACILAVLAAVAGRTMIGWPENLRLRISALATAAVFAGGLVVWLPGGPLGKGWARRAGTPASALSRAPARGGHS